MEIILYEVCAHIPIIVQRTAKLAEIKNPEVALNEEPLGSQKSF